MSERHIDVDVSIDADVHAHVDLPLEWEEARPFVERRFGSITQTHRHHEHELSRLHGEQQNMRETLRFLTNQIQQANAVIADRLHKMEFGLVFCGLAAIIGIILLVMITSKVYH